MTKCSIACLGVFLFCSIPSIAWELQPFGEGVYAVGSTNMRVAQEHEGIGDEKLHDYLLGRADKTGRSRYLTDILKHPKAAWTVDIPVPEADIYGPASGQTLPVVSFVTYPAHDDKEKNIYAFPYHNASYGVFEDMLDVDEAPRFADNKKRYPLIVIAHGGSAHGIYDVEHAHKLSSHGYIVAVINYGDERYSIPGTPNFHVGFLRPLITKAVIDSLLDSEIFGSRIDADNIGITGHSFGGFTALAMAGGLIQGEIDSVTDRRIKAGVVAAPWIAGNIEGKDIYAFGELSQGLQAVSTPILTLFGSKDEVTLSSYILPSIKQLSGPTYVVELIDQPHIFETGSWLDRDNWELLFFSAYLKHNPESLEKLKSGGSMNGGNEDIQLIEYQRLDE